MYTNELIHEKSPYLLQHAHNPVKWHAWNDETLKKVHEEKKMMLISIGYAACHWCHVMEHESFEDKQVASVMNEHFICIKVDREERPDVDQLYMNAAQLISGNGGWPLNAFALPNGQPFYACTYFPKEQWIQVLNYFADAYANNYVTISDQAEKLTRHIYNLEHPKITSGNSSFSSQELDMLYKNLYAYIDINKGGTQDAPKFPLPNIWEFLLQYHHINKKSDVLEIIECTLDHMACGGIYDQLGGGFARYSVDEDWHVPHFEKMLYDNAQLVSLYSQAWQVTGKKLYKEIVYETLGYIEHEMTSPEGGFYSSLDADSEGEEGKYYVWQINEIEQLLGAKKKAVFADYFLLSPGGNWEKGNNILHRQADISEVVKRHQLTEKELENIIGECKSILLQHRDKRIKPDLDNKIIVAWNALMLKAWIDAYRAFGEENFLEKALSNAEFLLKNGITDDGEIFRNCMKKQHSINGFLDDYAFSISAFLSLYQVTFNEKWLMHAIKLLHYVDEHFSDENSVMYYFSNNKYDQLAVRTKETHDNVIPASNSEMAKNLVMLSTYFNNEAYLKKANSMVLSLKEQLVKNPYFNTNWAIVALLIMEKPYEIAIVGDNFKALQQEMLRNYLPTSLFMGGMHGGSLDLLKDKYEKRKTQIFVCKNKTCQLPVEKVHEALTLIRR